MAAIRTGAMIGAITGKLGDDVYSRNQYGPYVKSKGTLTDPNTSYQQTIRDRLESCLNEWQDMTDDERTAWEIASQTGEWNVKDKLRDWHKPSGYNLFVKLNMKAWDNWSSPEILVPPQKEPLTALFIGSLSLSFGQLQLSFSSSTISANETVKIYATASYSTGIMKQKRNQFKYIVSFAEPFFTSPSNIHDFYITRFGSWTNGLKLSAMAQIVNTTTGQWAHCGTTTFIPS
jgi:hypothetical protein